jgi:heat-inducible transcriptional repressor
MGSSERPDERDRVAGMNQPEVVAPLDERKAAILRAVVNEHIETGQPVGSAHVSEAAQLNVSPATVRNDMSALERDGYLTHPHTSAGRIPTDRGYRYFVDSLTKVDGVDRRSRIVEPVAMQINEFYDRAHGELGRMLDHTSRMLSEITSQTAVVVPPQKESGQIRSVQLVGLGPTTLANGEPGSTALLVVVLANGVVEKAPIDFPASISSGHLAAATAHLGTLLVGTTIAQSGSVRPQSGDPAVDEVTRVAIDSLTPLRSAPDLIGLHVGGTSKLAGSFDALQTVRSVLSVLEEQYLVVGLLRETARKGMAVSIGAEHAADGLYESLATCSIVVAPYLIDGRVAGSVGVLGPTRMNYPQVIAAVEAVSSGLGDRLSERNEPSEPSEPSDD